MFILMFPFLSFWFSSSSILLILSLKLYSTLISLLLFSSKQLSIEWLKNSFCLGDSHFKNIVFAFLFSILWLSLIFSLTASEIFLTNVPYLFSLISLWLLSWLSFFNSVFSKFFELVDWLNPKLIGPLDKDTKLFFSKVLGAPNEIWLISELNKICWFDWGLFSEL